MCTFLGNRNVSFFFLLFLLFNQLLNQCDQNCDQKLSFQCQFSCSRGTSGIDIDLRRVDIDQCPQPAGRGKLNIFANSHKCKTRTTNVSLTDVIPNFIFLKIPPTWSLSFFFHVKDVLLRKLDTYSSSTLTKLLTMLYANAALVCTSRMHE